MIFRKVREKRHIKKHIKKPVKELFIRLDEIRMQSEVLAVCPAATGFNWMGVNRAAHNLFPDSTFEFPQYFSHAVYSEKELGDIARYIKTKGFTTVVLNGFPGYFAQFADQLKAADHGITVAVIYHGSLSELAGNEKLRTNFGVLVDLIMTGIISRIGFVKKGLPEFFENTYGVAAYPVILPPPALDETVKPDKFSDGKLHIGVFATHQFRKNVHNQVAAALMIKNAVVHLFTNSEMDIYHQNERLVMHPGNMKRPDFLSLLGSMDINLYNTYTETWGQVVVESLSMGVPCLTNNSSGVLDASPGLKKMLIVDEHDNPAAIAAAIRTTSGNSEKIHELTKDYLLMIKQDAKKMISDLVQPGKKNN